MAFNLKQIADELKKKYLNFTQNTIPQTAARVASSPGLNRVAQGIQAGGQRVATSFQQNPQRYNFAAQLEQGNVRSGVKPLDYAGQRVGSYMQNAWIKPAMDIPSAVRGIVKPQPMNVAGFNLNPNQARVANVGRLGLDVLQAIPDPSELLLGGYNAWKGISAGVGQKLPVSQVLEKGLKSTTFEQPVGLGEALVKEGPARDIINIAELPALLLGGVLKAKNLNAVEVSAIKKLGTTTNPAASLFITRAGKFLGGGKEGAQHLDIAKSILGPGTKEGSDLARTAQFAEMVFVPGVEINARFYRRPTGEQVRTIQDLAKKVPSVYIDFIDASGKVVQNFKRNNFDEFLTKFGKNAENLPIGLQTKPKGGMEAVFGAEEKAAQAGMYDVEFGSNKVKTSLGPELANPIIVNGKQVGSVNYSIKGKTAIVDTLEINPELRSQGYGTKAIGKIFQDNPQVQKIEGSSIGASDLFVKKIGGKVGPLEVGGRPIEITREAFNKSVAQQPLQDAGKTIQSIKHPTGLNLGTDVKEVNSFLKKQGIIIEGSGTDVATIKVPKNLMESLGINKTGFELKGSYYEIQRPGALFNLHSDKTTLAQTIQKTLPQHPLSVVVEHRTEIPGKFQTGKGGTFFSPQGKSLPEYGEHTISTTLSPKKVFTATDQYEASVKVFGKSKADKLWQEAEAGRIDRKVVDDALIKAEEKIHQALQTKGYDAIHYTTGDALSGETWVALDKNIIKQPISDVKIKATKPTMTADDLVKIQAEHERKVSFAKPQEITTSEKNLKLTESVIGEENKSFDDVFRRWIGQREVARTTGAEAGFDFRNIPTKKAEEFINHAEGVKQSSDPRIVQMATEWKTKTDALYGDLQSVAKKEGVDLGYIDEYVTHFWKESPEQVQQIMSAKGRSFGSRKVPTYAEGIDLGLTPKYKNPAEIMSEYVGKIEKTKANIGLFKEMKQRGLIVPASVGRNTPGFSPVNAPGFPRSVTSFEGKVFDGSYYAPTSIAREINRIFSPEDFGRTGAIFSRAAKISKGTQDIVLSGGIPKTPINAFTVAQMIKEFTSGSFVRPFKALVRSIFPESTMNYFRANANQIKKMQARNVTVRSTFDTQGLKGGGSTWDSLISDPTFKRFMPILQIDLFNNIEKRALGAGKNATEAADIAAKAVKNFYGLTDTANLAKRSQLGKDITSTFAFAPTYRESMINLWTNSLKALKHPFALENRQNIKFLIGAAITYGVMDYANRALNGHPMSENPQGKEDKLLIPAGDTTIGIPFLSSIATVPRGIYRIVKDGLNLDFKAAGADALRTFGSMLVKPVGEMILNEDYFGQEIVDPNASTFEKGKQIASYLFKSNNHPYIRAIMEASGTPMYQTLSKAMELPFRFYKTSSIANAPFWENYFEVKALDEQFQELKYKDPNKAVEFYNENKEKLDSLSNLKDQISAYYETGQDSKVLQEGGVIQGDGHMAFTGTDGKFHLIDTNFDVPKPEFTGNELLDKKIKSSYTSKLTALEKNVVTLFENGIITADQAEEALGGIKELKDSVKAPKKPKKITIKTTKFKAPTITVKKAAKTKIPVIKFTKPNIKKSTIQRKYTISA